MADQNIHGAFGFFRHPHQKEAVWQLLLASGYLKIRNIRYNYAIAAYEC